jgi:hypothetical protein
VLGLGAALQHAKTGGTTAAAEAHHTQHEKQKRHACMLAGVMVSFVITVSACCDRDFAVHC